MFQFGNRRFTRTWGLVAFLILAPLWLFFISRTTLPQPYEFFPYNENYNSLKQTGDMNSTQLSSEEEPSPVQNADLQNEEDLNVKPSNSEAVDDSNINSGVSHKIVTFYYPWYGNPEINGEWLHWNHQILVDNGAFYEPPEEIGANFYPMLGK
jgi:hypothetical protein